MICISCGRSVKRLNRDGDCAHCVAEIEKNREEMFARYTSDSGFPKKRPIRL
jgi:predicted amidophosphoribosyltransferase